jgi:hypothetical protein
MKNTHYLLVAVAIVADFASHTLAQNASSVIVEKHGDITTETEFKLAGTTNLNIQMLKGFSSVKQKRPALATAGEQSFLS